MLPAKSYMQASALPSQGEGGLVNHLEIYTQTKHAVLCVRRKFVAQMVLKSRKNGPGIEARNFQQPPKNGLLFLSSRNQN